jgi:predicted phage tail protein
MITLHLHGSIAEKYGTTFTMAAKTPAEIVHSLAVQLPGFKQDIEAGSWHVVRGDPDTGDGCDEEKLQLQMGVGEEVHLMPAVQGAGGGGGLFTTILGVVLIVAGYFTFGTTSAIGIGMIAGGAGLMVGGIVQMTMKMPGAENSTENADDRASFLFNGPRNQSSQGVAIPRGYGRCLVGSIVISAGLYAEDVAA